MGLKVAKSKRSGELYAQASLEDTVGKIDLICFPKDYATLAEELLKIEVPVLARRVACGPMKMRRPSCAFPLSRRWRT